MFIGSSGEGLRVAQALQAELEHDVDATIWSQGVFGLSGGTLESLVDATVRFDFATLVLTPDDVVTKRGSSGNAPRDNVLFEAGLFMGALGRLNTFLVSCRDDDLDLPSDLAGITRAEYNRRPNLRAAIGPVATNIRAALEAAPSGEASAGFEREDIEVASVEATSAEEDDELARLKAAVEALRDQATVVGTPDADLARLLAAVELLREQFKVRAMRAPLSTTHAGLFNALLKQVKRSRPRDPLVPLLPGLEGSDDGWTEAGVTGTYEEALEALTIMRSALVSA